MPGAHSTAAGFEILIVGLIDPVFKPLTAVVTRLATPLVAAADDDFKFTVAAPLKFREPIVLPAAPVLRAPLPALSTLDNELATVSELMIVVPSTVPFVSVTGAETAVVLVCKSFAPVPLMLIAPLAAPRLPAPLKSTVPEVIWAVPVYVLGTVAALEIVVVPIPLNVRLPELLAGKVLTAPLAPDPPPPVSTTVASL